MENYQWYPGHMAKAKKQMLADQKLVDIVIELTDARAPQSGRNPDIDEIARGRARLILLNKADLADERRNAEWIAWYKKQGIEAAAIDARRKKYKNAIIHATMDACHEKIERDRKRGIKNRPIRAMVTGIPNVGKSTLINSIAGKSAVKTGNKPGVTKGKQWIRLNHDLELLDTPGILWPKFDDPVVGRNLAMIGSMNDQILNLDELALDLIRFLVSDYPGYLAQRYQIEEALEPAAILESIGRSRNLLKKGAEIDYSRAALLLLEEFRSGRIGRITLEVPES